jgi:hypothetical protein
MYCSEDFRLNLKHLDVGLLTNILLFNFGHKNLILGFNSNRAEGLDPDTPQHCNNPHELCLLCRYHPPIVCGVFQQPVVADIKDPNTGTGNGLSVCSVEDP